MHDLPESSPAVSAPLGARPRRSKLDPDAGDPGHLARYRDLLALRRELPREAGELEVDEARMLLRARRGSFELVANFSGVEQDGVPARSGVVRR